MPRGTNYPPELVMDAIPFIFNFNVTNPITKLNPKSDMKYGTNQSSVEGEVVYKNRLTAKPH